MRGSCQFWERWNRLFFFFFRAAFPNLLSYWSSQSLGGLSDFSALQLGRKQLWALSHLGTVLWLQLSEHPHLPLHYQPVAAGLLSEMLVTWPWGKDGWALHRLEGAGWRWPSAVTGRPACSSPKWWSQLSIQLSHSTYRGREITTSADFISPAKVNFMHENVR